MIYDAKRGTEQKHGCLGGSQCRLGSRIWCGYYFLDDDFLIRIVDYDRLNRLRVTVSFVGRFLLASFVLQTTLGFPRLAKFQDAPSELATEKCDFLTFPVSSSLLRRALPVSGRLTVG